MKWEIPFSSRRFMTRTVLHPYSQTDRTMIRHLLGNNSDPVVEDGFSEHEESTASLGYFRDESSEPASGRAVACFLQRFFSAEPNLALFIDLQDFHHDLVALFQDVADPANPLGSKL